jgi:superfamily II DNA or RNA helicase
MLAAHLTDAAGRALELLRARRGAILADDVGLGKSYVAAEVMRRFDEVDLIVPAALIVQWRETLARFDVHATLLTHDALLRDAFVAEPRERLVVVDEAHAFRNPKTQRYAALARRTAGARVLLVTATPVCNGIADLEALVRLIARDDLLADAGIPSIDAAFETRDRELIAQIVASLVIRRDRSVLPEELRFGDLQRSVVRHPVLDANGIDTLEFPLVEDCAILRRFLWRRLESSEAAFLESLRRQQRFYERALAAVAAGRTLRKSDYRRAFGHEEDFQEVLFWDLFAPAGEADPHAIREELYRIGALMELARDSPNAKRKLLEGLLTGEPTLIFTGSAATARDLHAGIRGSGLVTSKERSRDAVLHAFRNGKLDVVVSTDMAAEGLNLQRAAVVIHYDIPWNPVKLDQRNGRAHRIGQQRDTVRAIYFLPDRRNTKIVETIARKNRDRKRALTNRQPPTGNRQPTLRPRITRDAAVTRLSNPPEALQRRHKAGIERLIQENCRMSDLLALVAIECPA